MSFLGSRYRGHDLLTEMPNGRQDRDQRQAITRVTKDGGTGQVAFELVRTTPIIDVPTLWTLEGRAEITDFVLWLAERRGRYSPCWVPSWRADLVLADDAAADDDTLMIEAVSYVDRYLPHEARRHLAIMTAANGAITITPRRVDAAEDNGDGTETLTLDVAIGVALRAGAELSFLHLARLAEDPVTLEWNSLTVAEAETRFVELPRELEAGIAL